MTISGLIDTESTQATTDVAVKAALSALSAILDDTTRLAPDEIDFDLALGPTVGDHRRVKAIRAALAAYEQAQWRPISEARKDGSVIWARLKIPAERLAERENLERFDGIDLPLRHPGVYEKDGRVWDHGWNIAAPVGHGGFPDEWIAAWRHVPANSPYFKTSEVLCDANF